MKKCPYCAEKIKDDAIKCKHCGEWLNTSQENIESSPISMNQEDALLKGGDYISASNNSKPELIDSSGIKEEEPPIHTEDSIPSYDNDDKGPSLNEASLDITSIPVPKLEISRIPFGWGWFLLLSFFIAGFRNSVVNLRSDRGEALYTIFIIFLSGFLLFIYIKVRRNFIIKKRFRDVWVNSLISGIISYLIVFVILLFAYGGIQNIDANNWNKYLDARLSSLKAEAQLLLMEEENIWEKFKYIPGNLEDLNKCIKDIDRCIEIKEREHNISNEYYDLITKTYQESVNAFLPVNNMGEEIFKKYIDLLHLLRSSYVDKNHEKVESTLIELIDLEDEGMILQEKVQEVLKNMFPGKL